MPRFYVSAELSPGLMLELPDNVLRHLHVLRVKAGEEITLFNGNGRAYAARLTALEKRCAAALVLDEAAPANESPLRITLIQAVSGGERMDFTLQKSVELGVAEIWPVLSERSIVRLAGERADKRVARWQEIVVSACEQSGRNVVPQVRPLQSCREALAALPAADARLLLGLNHAQSLQNAAAAPRNITFMVGPEGGWTAAEEQQASAAGFRSVMLGPRVLRTETAALAAIAAMQVLWGDFV